MKDHIVEEVRQIRDRQAARFNYDIDAILEDARKRQGTSGHKVVSHIAKRKKRTA